MAIKKLTGLTEEELGRIRTLIGESFVTNELFHNWGSVEERRDDVMRYMSIYTDFVYEAGELYSNEDGTGFIGLEDSAHAPKWPQIRMLCRLLAGIKFKKIKALMKFVKQIEGSNAKYAKQRHIDALMVCVDRVHQGKGIATELVDFAKEMAQREGVPLLFDTDMEAYADMYQHFGCELYNEVTADNGVTRYSLCYKPREEEVNK